MNTCKYNILSNSKKNFWCDPNKHFDLVLNSKWYRLISKLNGSIFNSTFEFYKELNYLPTCFPVTCNSISSPMGLGSDSFPVKIKLFNKETYLNDSMQFYLEYILRQGVKGAFYAMPSFRGDSPDSRHLNQFFHSEAEIVGNLEDIMLLVEKYIIYITKKIKLSYGNELLGLVGSIDHIDNMANSIDRFPRITFKEAQDLLTKFDNCFKLIDKKYITITNIGEKELINIFNGPVWLTYLPKMSAPFYQAVNPNDQNTVLAADLLMGIGETIGCGERHTNLDQTLLALREHGVHKADYKWYLDLKRKYPLQTAGFGMGIERYLLWLLKHNDIRDIPIIQRIKGHNSII